MVTNLPITLVFLPASDIAQYVGEGNVDIGITGEDIVAESGVAVTTALKLGFGKCKLALQVNSYRQLPEGPTHRLTARVSPAHSMTSAGAGGAPHEAAE